MIIYNCMQHYYDELCSPESCDKLAEVTDCNFKLNNKAEDRKRRPRGIDSDKMLTYN